MSDDLISRSALKAVINEYIDEYSDLDNQGYHCEKWCAMKEAEMAIDNAPTVERPQGKWQLHGMIYYCSECGHECGESGDNFCGNCGADMRGE